MNNVDVCIGAFDERSVHILLLVRRVLEWSVANNQDTGKEYILKLPVVTMES